MRKDLAGLLKANREALRHFAEGAKYERCRYPLDLTQGYDLVYRSFTKLETASLLMELSTLSHADSKQPEQAASDVSIGLALVNSLSDAPTTLAQLLRARMISYVLAGLEQAINRSFLPETACVDLSRAFQKMEGRDARGDSFNRTLAGERAQALAALGNPRQLLRALEAPDLKMSAEERSRIKARLHSGEMLTAERDFFEDAFSQLQAARQAPFPERLKADALGRQLMALSTENNLPVLDLFLPGLCRRAALEAECLAELRLGWTAVALERFRTVHDQQYPARLSQLSPEYLSSIPTDPFDGHPLRYQQHGGGYTLYSIGPDLKDDSGQPMNRKDGDIVFTVVTSVR